METLYCFSDGNVTIRPFAPDDASAVYEAIQESGAGLTQWMPDLHVGLSVQDIEGWIEVSPRLWTEGTAYNFAIVDGQDGRFLGGCGLTHVRRGHGFANLYYWVRSSGTGRGVATAATRLIARFGFERLGLQRVEIVMAVDNEASARVAEKAGALREGTLRKRLYLHGRSHDAHMYSLVPSDLGM